MLLIALLSVVAVGVFGCKNDPITEEFGVYITLPGKNARAVFYDISEVATYSISVTQNDFVVVSKTANPGSTVKIKLENLGDYKVTVTAKDSTEYVIASGTAFVSFVEGDGYKDVVIDIEPCEKEESNDKGIIISSVVWEVEREGYFTSADAVQYDVTIYDNDIAFAEYEDVSILNETYTINIPWHKYTLYKIKVEAKQANLNVIGSGEADFTLAKSDTFKNLTITIKAERKTLEESLADGFGINAGLNWVEGYRGEKVQFGEWPQSLADVSDLTLSETGKTYDGHPEYFADDGNKYVYVEGAYYKVEPMTWRVLAYNSDGSKKLLADKIYTNIEYYYYDSGNRTLGSKTIYPNNYKYSNVRAYLNSINNQFVTDGGTATKYDVDWRNKGFLTSAFTDAERAKIKQSVVDNSAETTHYSNNEYICENTIDKIYLLSYAEATKKLYGLDNDSDRMMKQTAYAWANIYLSHVYPDETEDGINWWLRSPYHYENYVEVVYDDADEGFINGNAAGYTYFGVVPALMISE